METAFESPLADKYGRKAEKRHETRESCTLPGLRLSGTGNATLRRGMVLPTRRFALGVATALLVGSCLAPTLPLPPPDQPTVEGPDEGGVTHLSGRVETGAWVYAINRSSDMGSFQATGDSGEYDLTLITQVGDGIVLWYEIGSQTSERLEFEIRAPAPAP